MGAVVQTRTDLQRSIAQMIEEMRAVEIRTDQEYEFMDGWLHRNKDSQKAVDAAFEEERLEKKAAYDDVLEAKKLFKKPLEDSEKIARQKMTAYATVKEKARRDEQQRLDDIARKEAEDRRLAQAQKLADKGQSERANALLEKELRVSAPQAEAPIGKTREVWRVNVNDSAALLRAIADGKVRADFVTINTTVLAQPAQQLKGAFAVPGVSAFVEYVPVL